ncbi:11395_t:CDS:2 [Paraglomus brasilianum]|uniref:11395_t:CDS:1 n=1 Tax=Paraglomus brasilianum TaxID=144538 RepID=A0A9N9DG65_9GLOM|nr:11395_t:CDS:2 [Paraglomus brasilianum]
MDGKLVAADGKTVVKSWTNTTRMDENPYADGVSDLLTAAGANLDAPSTAPGANSTDRETYRSSDGNEYKEVESLYQSDGSYILKERMAFDCIVAAFALFKVATIVVEVLMLNIVPEKRVYEKARFEVTTGSDDI